MITKKYWSKLSFLQKNVLLTILVILMLIGSMSVLNFNIFQNSMLSIYEKHSVDTGDMVVHKLDTGLIEDLAKDPTTQRVKKETLVQQLGDVSKELKTIGHLYVTDVKTNNKGELQVVGITTELSKATKVQVGDYAKQPSYWMEAYDKVMSSKKPQVSAVYKDDIGTWVTILEPIMGDDQKIVAIVAIDVDASIITSTKQKFIIQSLIFISIFLIIATLVQFFIVRSSLAPLKELREGLRKVGDGDLSIKLRERSDDIGVINTYFNNTIEKFRKIIEKVKETSEQVSSSSQELSASTEENSRAVQEIAGSIEGLNEGAHSQQTSVQQCLEIVNEMGNKMQAITGAAGHVAEAAEGMEEHSVKGNKAIEQIIQQMSLIQKAVQDLSSIIYSLENRSKQISDIVTVITGISNQTNLLALNASIEAARAGEAGKGFAVVAEEVRKLAEQTETSAKDISKLISETQTETEQAVVSMQKGSQEVESGISLVQSSGVFFAEILQSAQSVTKQVKEVSGTSSHVSQNSKDIVHLVNDLSNIAKTYVESTNYVEESMKEQEMSVQEVAELASCLNVLAYELRELIAEFKS
ncbi:methyl-accepting chemotaxis protein [Bacillus sp. CGMCC 1.60114]|uniref:methyl-accepting chemotaxis protein n=1 Tax=unclassified Bacillus (in: firmicutes) TaxID=185979 RepID=UPI003626A540